jgi:hypothetical protein
MKFLAFSALFFSSMVFAQNLTTVKASYRCEEAGGGIAFKEPTQSKPARIWQTDKGDNKGLELKVTDFTIYRCPGCFSFQAVLMNSINVRGEIISNVLKYDVQDPETGAWQNVLKDVECKKVR